MVASYLLYSVPVNIANSAATRSSESSKHETPAKFGFLTNDESAFQRLLETHLPRVRTIVERIRRRLPSTLEADDLYSIGVTGLVVAARNCRPDQEPSFGSYANTRIEGAILDELRRMDYMSRGNRAKAKRLGTAISKLEQEQGGNIREGSLCAEMQMTEKQLAELQEDVREVR